MATRKLGTHYPYVHGPCPVDTGVKNYTNVHRPYWSPAYPTRAVDTGVTRVSFFDIRVHGPWIRPVNMGVILDTRVHGCHKVV